MTAPDPAVDLERKFADALEAEWLARLADPPGWEDGTNPFTARVPGILAALRESGIVLTPEPAARDGLDVAYRERNALVAALIRVGGYKAEVVMAPDTEGWWIVYAETPAGQVSWHISPDDMDLFSDWPVAFGSHHSPWDGHTTEEKYRRVAALHSEETAP